MTVVETDNSLVSITIPTFNSAQTVAATLTATQSQTYKPIEITVVDSHSSDETAAIAEEFGVPVIQIEGRLLKARQVGALAAHGDFVLLLDSDQILEPTAIERAVRLARQGPYDMLFFEEHAYRPRTWLQRLFELDRRAIQRDAVLDPKTSVMLPRFFRCEVLAQAFAAMPVDELMDVVAQDHAIIHWEVGQVARRSAVLPNAVSHLDPSDVVDLLKHFYSKGRAAKKLERNQVYATRYKEVFDAKSRSRGFSIGRRSAGLESNLVLLLKGVPYIVGKWLG